MTNTKKNAPAGTVNLASPNLGTKVVSVSDEFFAAGERMLSDSVPVFRPDVYDDHGKWMDGWETRRRRDGGEYDWALVKLGATGNILQAEIDTTHFTGNYPPYAALEGCTGEEKPDEETEWRTLVEKNKLQGDASHIFEIEAEAVDWVRVKIYPDGGIARLRLWGRVYPDWDRIARDEMVELSCLRYGGRIVAYSDAHYGDVQALISERPGENMGDGWETRRRRDGGNDWIIVALGREAIVRSTVVDTAYFRGNYPHSFSLCGAYISENLRAETIVDLSEEWGEIIPSQKLEADNAHAFDENFITEHKPVNYVRLNIYPDGGVSRLRIYGAPFDSQLLDEDDE